MMQIPVQVSFKDMRVSDAVERRIWEEAEDLERYAGRLTSCRVVVDSPHRRGVQGQLYRVLIDITLPGGEVAVGKGHRHEDHAHEDVYVAIRDAFDTARRQVEDFVRKQRGDVKTHEAPQHGRICRLLHEDGFGFIAAADGRELYFHRNSVLSDEFDSLDEGDEVRFIEEQGMKGPNAKSVQMTGRHLPLG